MARSPKTSASLPSSSQTGVPAQAGIHLSTDRATDEGVPAFAGTRVEVLERAVAFDLGAVHDAPCRRVEGVAPVHHAAIVPQNQIAGPPLLIPGEFGLGSVLPQ